jgi:hypothetical protein
MTVGTLLNMVIGVTVGIGIVAGFWLLVSFSGDLLQRRGTKRTDR